MSFSFAIGKSLVFIKSETLYVKPLPSAPDGWKIKKSSSVNPRFSNKQIAKASPTASVTVVDAVGALPRGHAYFSTETSRITSLA